MIWNAVELAAVLVECLITSRLIILFLGYRSEYCRIWKSFSLFITLSFFDWLFTNCLHNDLLFIIALFCSCVLFSVLFLNGRLFEKIFLPIVCYLLFCFINLPVLHGVSYITNVSVGELVVAQNASRVISLLLTKLIYFGISELVLIYRRKNKFNFSKSEWIVLFSAFLIALLIGTFMYFISVAVPEQQYMCLIVVILITILDCIIVLFMQKLNLANKRQLEQNMLKLQLFNQQQELQQMNNSYQKISILRHDLKNEMLCIRELLTAKRYDKALAYADQIVQQKINSVQEPVECSSSIINAVINTKFGEAQEKDIKTVCQIHIPIPEELELDISIILFNLLDNAIAYEEQGIENAQISVSITKTAGYLRILVKNKIKESVLCGNSKLTTSKKDKIHHGWGLKSVRDILRDRNGEIDFYEKRNEFSVNIIIPEI